MQTIRTDGVVSEIIFQQDAIPKATFISGDTISIWGLSSENIMERQEEITAGYEKGGDYQSVLNQLLKLQDSGEPLLFELPYIHQNGKLSWHRVIVSPLEKAPKSHRWHIFIQDQTHEYQTAIMMRDISPAMKMGMWEIKLEENGEASMYLDQNCQQIGELEPLPVYKANDVLGLVVPEYLEDKKAYVRGLTEKETYGEFVTQIRTHTTKELKWLRVVSKSKFQNGRCNRLIGSIQDITADKNREKELLDKTRFLTGLNQISNEIIKQSSIEDTIQKILKIAGETCKIQRCFYFANEGAFDESQINFKIRNEWVLPGFPSLLGNSDLESLPQEEYQKFFGSHNTQHAISTIVSQLPNGPLKTFLTGFDLKSFLIVPLISEEKIIGFIGFDDFETERIWTESEKEFLESIANVLSELIIKTQYLNQLTSSKSRYKFMFKELLDGIAIIQDGKFVDCNPGFAKMIGYERREIIGQTPDGISPEFQLDGTLSTEAAQKFLQEASQSGNIIFDWLHQRKDGTQFIGQVRLNKTIFQGKEAFFSVTRDITEINLAQHQILQLSEAVEQSPVAVIIFDINGKITYANKKALENSGFNSEEILTLYSKTLEKAREDRKQFPDLWDNLLNGENWTGIVEQKNKSGLTYWESVSYSPLIDENGEIIKIISVREDISERKAYQSRLEENEQIIREVTEKTQTVIWEVDLEGKYTYLNSVASEVYGHPVSDMVGKIHYYDLQPPSEKEAYKNSTLPLLKAEKLITDFETVILSGDGKYKWIRTTGYPYYDEDKTLIGYRGIDIDITNEKESTQELEKSKELLEERASKLQASNKELEQFAYTVSHDLQEPMRMVISFMEQLQRKYSHQLDDKAEQYIDFAVNGAVRMRQIIMELLNYSRIGRSDGEPEVIDLSRLIQKTMNDIKADQDCPNVNLKLDEIPNIKSFTLPITQIFLCLLDNAVKFRNPDLECNIEVSYQDKNDFHEFCVNDNGIGIDPSNFDAIFTIFRQLHTRTKYDGLGMGLALVKKQVENLKGEISVKSAKGVGSSFCFTIKKI